MKSKKRLRDQKISEIRRLARNKLNEINYTGGAVDIDTLAQTLGASVRYAPYNDGELAGMLVRNEGKKPVIAVNSAHHPNRRRFTIAHECGHLLLHSNPLYVDEKLSVMKRDSNSSLAISQEEVEANQFAAEVLMPYNELLSEVSDLNIDIEDDAEATRLAKKYKVSLQAMTYRIYNITASRIFSRG